MPVSIVFTKIESDDLIVKKKLGFKTAYFYPFYHTVISEDFNIKE